MVYLVNENNIIKYVYVGKMGHKVNFEAEKNWFEIRVFVLLNQLPNQS